MTSKQILSVLSKSQNIAIFPHVNPDLDAYGSAFAMKEYLKNSGKNAEIIAIQDDENYLNKIFPLKELKTEFIPAEYDTILMVDLHESSRVHKKFLKDISNFKNIVVIDHHELKEQELFQTKNRIIDNSYAACSQLIGQIFVDNNIEITKKMATYLWAGVIGDTGRFLHSNLTKDVLKIAEILMEKGAEVQKVYDSIYRQNSLKQIRIRNAFVDKMKMLNDGKIAYVIFTLRDKKKFGVIDDDIKTNVNELINIEGVDLSIVCREAEHNYYKISLRSSANFNSQKFCAQFGGGGHKCAAGFELATTKRKLEKMIPIWVKDFLK